MGNNNAPMAMGQQVGANIMKISDPMGRQVDSPPPPPSPSWSTTENVFGALLTKDTGTLKRLRRKLKTKLRKGSNHSHVFREFANFLSIRELAQIYEEYKSTFFLKELFHHAQNARPVASNVRTDLSKLFDSKCNSDITLVFKGVEFAVHKAIVCVRCPFFRELLSKRVPGSTVEVELEINELRVELFSDLLKFLYTGELTISEDSKSNSTSYKTLMRISQECGVPNALPKDLKYLFDTGIYSDASLCFQFSPDYDSSLKRCLCLDQAEFACHQVVLAARSPFFRSVIERQLKRTNTLKADTLNQRMRIVLDECIIPRRFGRVLLHIMYRDADDFGPLVQSSTCKCGSTSKDSGQVEMAKELMDLYEIGRFLELDSLIHATEDLIVESLCLDTLIAILKWSEQPHGSPHVKRQAMGFLKEEFTAIASAPSLLGQLESHHLMDVLNSDFVETSELELLKAIVKWGELKLQGAFTDSELAAIEPNLISSTLSRRTLRKKDVDDTKLAALVSPLMSAIRVGHILPVDSDHLQSAIKRGLIETLPPFMQTDPSVSGNRVYAAWFRHRSNEHFIRPRLFLIYFEECKAILEQRLGYRISAEDDDEEEECEDIESVVDDNLLLPPIPDALYMVHNLATGTSSVVSDGDLLSPTSPMGNFNFCFTASSASSVNGFNENYLERPTEHLTNLPSIDETTLTAMREREKELRASPFCLRVLKVSYNRCHALRYIQLRVVREFGLPDIACEVLHQRGSIAQRTLDATPTEIDFTELSPQDSDIPPPPPPRRNRNRALLPTQTSDFCDPFSLQSELQLETSRYELQSQFSGKN